MRKFIYCAAAVVTAAACAAAFAACAREIDYSDFISERRFKTYLYEDDDISVKVNLSSRENPYLSDGFKGEMQDVYEIFVQFFTSSPESVDVRLGEEGGEMSYMSVTNSYYMSFSGGDLGESAHIELEYGDTSRELDAPSVLYSGVISCEEALECTRQYDGQTFEDLTDGENVEGEIYVRLICDGGKCYYYVGVADREGDTKAYLVDGESGSVIAERTIKG